MNKKLKESYHNQVIVPPTEVWGNIEKTLNQSKSRLPFWLWIFFSILTIGGLSTVFTQTFDYRLTSKSIDYKTTSFEKEIFVEALENKKMNSINSEVIPVMESIGAKTITEEFNDNRNENSISNIVDSNITAIPPKEIKNTLSNEKRKDQKEANLNSEVEIEINEINRISDMDKTPYLKVQIGQNIGDIQDTTYLASDWRKSLNGYNNQFYIGIHIDQFRQKIGQQEFQNFEKNNIEDVSSKGVYFEYHRSLGKKNHVFFGGSYRRVLIKGESFGYPITFDSSEDIEIEEGSDGNSEVWFSPTPNEDPLAYCIRNEYYQLHTGFSHTIIDKEKYRIDIHAGARASILNKNLIEYDETKFYFDTQMNDYSLILGPQVIINPNKRFRIQMKPEIAWNWDKKYNPSFGDPNVFIRYNFGFGYSF